MIRRPSRRFLDVLAAILLAADTALAAQSRMELRYLPLPLPAAPSAVLSADLDVDGDRDLIVVVAYTRWGQIEIEESTTMDDIEGLVESLTVIPSLVEKREIRVFPGRPGGGFEPGSVALPVDRSVLSLEAGPPGLPVIAMTDDGVSVLRMKPGASEPSLSLERVLSERSVLAGTGTFFPGLKLVHDIDGDKRADLLFPTSEGASVYLSDTSGLRTSPAARVRFPLDDLQERGRTPLVRRYPLAELRDLDGDRPPDLILPHPVGGLRGFRVLRNLGAGRFGEPIVPLGEHRTSGFYDFRRRRSERSGRPLGGPIPVWVGDLDNDGRAEYVTQEEKGTGRDAGVRQEMKEAKNPRILYRLHRSRADLTMEPKPYQQFEAEGYALSDGGGDSGFKLPGGLQDLNGDGRQDLVTMSLDFSMLQAVKIMTVQRIGIRLDFHVWCQAGEAGGGFKAVPGLDLSGKFNLNLKDLTIGHLSQFEGDFDGDGRSEFVQMGRGRAVTIHRGLAGCRYNESPDLALQLEEEPRDLRLVQIRDFNGDALSDLLVIQPQPPRKTDERGVSRPVRLDFYFSGGGR